VGQARRAIGAVLPGNRVLVTPSSSAMRTASNSKRGRRPESAWQSGCRLRVQHAVLKPTTPRFSNIAPLGLHHRAVGDILSVWRLENSGTAHPCRGPMTAAKSRAIRPRFPLHIYRLTAPLSFAITACPAGRQDGKTAAC
jgi:hypothetical protein